MLSRLIDSRDLECLSCTKSKPGELTSENPDPASSDPRWPYHHRDVFEIFFISAYSSSSDMACNRLNSFRAETKGKPAEAPKKLPECFGISFIL
jgi:hypothetical protein